MNAKNTGLGSLGDRRRGGADILRVRVPGDMLGHEERPKNAPTTKWRPR